ncbi:unnamed protein product [Lampetra fluviatilis]
MEHAELGRTGRAGGRAEGFLRGKSSPANIVTAFEGEVEEGIPSAHSEEELETLLLRLERATKRRRRRRGEEEEGTAARVATMASIPVGSLVAKNDYYRTSGFRFQRVVLWLHQQQRTPGGRSPPSPPSPRAADLEMTSATAMMAALAPAGNLTQSDGSHPGP